MQTLLNYGLSGESVLLQWLARRVIVEKERAFQFRSHRFTCLCQSGLCFCNCGILKLISKFRPGSK